jgi:hypothetical protein
MKTYNVQTRIESDDNTNILLLKSFENLKDAESFLNETLANVYPGQYVWENQFRNLYSEILEIEVIDEDGDFETAQEVTVYTERTFDKNNWRGNYASNYWGVGRFDGTELVYDFSFQGEIQYQDIKESELNNWYNY